MLASDRREAGTVSQFLIESDLCSSIVNWIERVHSQRQFTSGTAAAGRARPVADWVFAGCLNYSWKIKRFTATSPGMLERDGLDSPGLQNNSL